jgi:hypothetical protein
MSAVLTDIDPTDTAASPVEPRQSVEITKLSKRLHRLTGQAIIDFKWPLAREYTIKVLFIPFCIYLAVFVTWSNVFNNFVYPLDEGSWFSLWAADKVLCAILYFFSVYFLSNELR